MSSPTPYLVTAVVTFPIEHVGELGELVARAEIETRVALWDATVQHVATIEVDS